MLTVCAAAQNDLEDAGSPDYIPQIPLEDILDEFCVFVTDFYEDLNNAGESVCYQEFGAGDIEDYIVTVTE